LKKGYLIIVLILVIGITGILIRGLKPQDTTSSETPPSIQTPTTNQNTSSQTEPVKQVEEQKPPYEITQLRISPNEIPYMENIEIVFTVKNNLPTYQVYEIPEYLDNQLHETIRVELEPNETMTIRSIIISPEPATHNVTIGTKWETFTVFTNQETPQEHTYDIENQEIPQFVSIDFTQLEKIAKISRFRSSAGHDYSDDSEDCRSMKHYYEPKPEYLKNQEIEIHSPVDGEIVRLLIEHRWPEAEGDYQITIKPDNYPAFNIILFHVDLTSNITEGTHVQAGVPLGYAHLYYPSRDEYAHDFDIAVGVDTPQGYRLISYFQIMSPELFETYRQRGIQNIDQLIISKPERDAYPLTCIDGQFTGTDPLDVWVALG